MTTHVYCLLCGLLLTLVGESRAAIVRVVYCCMETKTLTNLQNYCKQTFISMLGLLHSSIVLLICTQSRVISCTLQQYLIIPDNVGSKQLH